MNYTNEAWEEEQMSNLGCESVSDLIEEVIRLREEVKRLREAIEYAIVHAENHDVIRVLDEVMSND